MYFALIVFSTWISYFDLRFHRISNRTLGTLLIVLSVSASIENSDLHQSSALLVSSLSIIGYKYGLGAGDVKLAVLLSLFFLPYSQSAFSDAVMGFAAISSISILAHLSFGRKMGDSIALAPAICGAFIWCAR